MQTVAVSAGSRASYNNLTVPLSTVRKPSCGSYLQKSAWIQPLSHPFKTAILFYLHPPAAG